MEGRRAPLSYTIELTADTSAELDISLLRDASNIPDKHQLVNGGQEKGESCVVKPSVVIKVGPACRCRKMMKRSRSVQVARRPKSLLSPILGKFHEQCRNDDHIQRR